MAVKLFCSGLLRIIGLSSKLSKCRGILEQKKSGLNMKNSLNSSIDMWGSFIVHASFLWEILFRKCGEGKYVGSFLSYWVEVRIYINIEVGMGR